MTEKEWKDPEQPEWYDKKLFPRIKVTTEDIINDLTYIIKKDYGNKHADKIRKSIKKNLKKRLKKK